MIRRVNQQQKHGAPPAELLVCFPSRAHLTLIPKKLSSPARLMDHSFRHHHRNNQLKKQADPSWDKAKKATTSSGDVSEPSSPKVTCAGQIKVQPNRYSAGAANCKSWQSVMEEIERIHKKSKKKASWGDALGIKKDVMQFLTCLRNIKLDFRCFRAVPECDLSSDEDDEEDDDDRNKKNVSQSESECKEDQEAVSSDKDSRTVLSDWFMVLQDVDSDKVAGETPSAAPPPPPNALLLMRCRSAPAKSWLENRAKLILEQQDEKESDHKEAHTHQQQQEKEEAAAEGEKGRKKLRDYLLVMEQYDTDFYKLSNDIAKETWVVGSINPFTRSRSWKR